MKKRYIICIGALIILAGVLLAMYDINDGCGACGGEDARLSPAFFATRMFRIEPSSEACALLGCSFPIRPLYLDIFAIGLLFVVVPIFRKK